MFLELYKHRLMKISLLFQLTTKHVDIKCYKISANKMQLILQQNVWP
jgi:hypothetical protein